MQKKALFSDAFLSHKSLPKRLIDGVSEAWTEFRENPHEFLKEVINGSTQNRRRANGLRLGLAVSIFLYSAFLLLAFLFWTGARPNAGSTSTLFTVQHLFNPGEFSFVKPEQAQSDKSSRPGGGGGGGDNQNTPASFGQPPQFSLRDPLVAPTTRPQLNPPPLPVPVTLLADPNLQPPRDDITPMGLPDGIKGPSSDGPGQDHGIGNGRKGGVGDGDGLGLRNGNGWNLGGKNPQLTGC